jgi:hypothetical protein
MTDTQVLLASHHLKHPKQRYVFSALQRQTFLYRIVLYLWFIKVGLNSTVKHMNLHNFENAYYHNCWQFKQGNNWT